MNKSYYFISNKEFLRLLLKESFTSNYGSSLLKEPQNSIWPLMIYF